MVLNGESFEFFADLSSFFVFLYSTHNNLTDFNLHLDQIRVALEQINTSISLNQSSVTNQPWFQFIIGSAVTLAATLIHDYLRNRRNHKNYLYYLQRMLVDQVNLVTDIRRTTQKFLDSNLKQLVTEIENNPEVAYSANSAFFPLFSARPLPNDINLKSTGSGYVDHKVAKVYALSQDLPHIIDDLRHQFNVTTEKHERIALGKLNSPEVQKEQYKSNILAYEEAVRHDLLEINIPLYLSKLTETLIPLNEKINKTPISWKLRFDPRWKFYIRKKVYLEARNQIIEKMDAYFRPVVDRKLEEIEQLHAEQ